MMGEAYPKLKEQHLVIEQILKEEEMRFQLTLEQGMKLLQQSIEAGDSIDGKTAFVLYDTYGFLLRSPKI